MTTEQKHLLKAEVFDHNDFCEDFTIHASSQSVHVQFTAQFTAQFTGRECVDFATQGRRQDDGHGIGD